MKPIIKAVRLFGGRIGLAIEPVAQIRSEEGSSNVISIANATQKDVDWVRAMGGHVPDGRVVKQRRKP